MKQDRIMTAMGVFWLGIGILSMLSGHAIFGLAVGTLGFVFIYLRGRGSYNDRSLYEKQVKAGIGIDQLYEKLKDMETPLGKAWLAGHKDFTGDCIIFGPNVFWDFVLIARKGSRIVIRHSTQPDKIISEGEDSRRLEGLAKPSEYEVTPEKYAIYAGFKLASTLMLDHLRDIVEGLAAGRNVTIPGSLEQYRFYYHNSSEGWFRNSDGADVLEVEASLHPFRAAVLDADGEEMAAVVPRAFNKKDEPVDKAGYELTANGEHFGEIRSFRDREGGGFIAETEDGTYRISIFPACSRGKISCNYRIERDGELKAVIGGSPGLTFTGLGSQRNDMILSYDDDYLVLYAAVEVFILTLFSRFLK